MRAWWLVAGLVAAGPALGQTPAPAMVCVPSALLNQIGAYVVNQPYKDVAVIVAQLMQNLNKPVACGVVENKTQ